MTAAGGVPRSRDNTAPPGWERDWDAVPGVLRLLRPWRAIAFDEITGGDSVQRQMLYPGVCWGPALSCGFVRMPAGHMAAPHLHQHADLVVTVLAGWVASLLWHPAGGEVRVVEHGPGDMIEIPAGWGHIGASLSRTLPVYLHEARTDPEFNVDVQRLPEWDGRVRALARRRQRAWSRPVGQPYTVIERLADTS